MPYSFDVTLRKLQLGSRDSVTGWYAKSFNDDATITMIIVHKGTAERLLPAGVFIRKEVLGMTQDVVTEGDEIKIATGKYYEVETVAPHYLGDGFWFRTCDLTLLPLKFLTGGTYTASSVEDARYRTKVYLETYLSSSALPHFIVAYGMPDYPMVRIFKEKGVDLVFSVGEPNSTPMLDAGHAAYGYAEHVPITTFCTDKTNIEGAKLKWQAETELRRILETYPLGSLRSLDRRRDNDQHLGSTILYSTEFTLRYVRDTD